MKKTKFSLSGFVSKLAILTVFLFGAAFLGENQITAQAYNLPSLKSANTAINDLQAAHDLLLPQAKQAGPGSQQMITVSLYKRMIDALTNRPDVNMDTYSVLISNIDVNYYANLVKKNGNALDVDGTIKAVLNTPEYQLLVAVIKQ